MMPFGGFMQAIASGVPALEGKIAGVAKNLQRLSDSNDTSLPADGDVSSFMEWVQQLMARGAATETGGESVTDIGAGGSGPETGAFDQLQALIAEFMDQAPTKPSKDPAADAQGCMDWINALPPVVLQAILAQDGSGQSATPGGFSGVQAMTAATETPPAETISPTDDSQAGLQINTADPAAQGGRENEQPVFFNPTGDELDDGHGDGYPSPASGTDPDSSMESRFAVQPPSAEAGRSRQAVRPDAVNPTAATLAGERPDASKDETADFDNSDMHRRDQRFTLASAGKNEFQHTQMSDALKSAIAEPTQTHQMVHGTEKSMVGEPSMFAAEKQAVGHTGVMTQPEATAAKTLPTTVMEQIVDKAVLRATNGRSEIQISLKPDFLGNVQMNISTEKEQLVVRILTDQPVVKEIIETHLHQLKAELHNQGLVVHKFDVMVNPETQQHSGDQFDQMFRNGSFQNGRRRSHDHNPETWNQGGGNPSDDDRPLHDGVDYFA